MQDFVYDESLSLLFSAPKRSLMCSLVASPRVSPRACAPHPPRLTTRAPPHPPRLRHAATAPSTTSEYAAAPHPSECPFTKEIPCRSRSRHHNAVHNVAGRLCRHNDIHNVERSQRAVAISHGTEKNTSSYISYWQSFYLIECF